MFLLRSDHDVTRPVVTLHEELGILLLGVVDFTALHHRLVASMSNSTLAPLFHHGLKVIVFLLCVEVPRSQPVEWVELCNFGFYLQISGG